MSSSRTGIGEVSPGNRREEWLGEAKPFSGLADGLTVRGAHGKTPDDGSPGASSSVADGVLDCRVDIIVEFGETGDGRHLLLIDVEETVGFETDAEEVECRRGRKGRSGFGHRGVGERK